jgi:hypothetical protein
MASYHFARRLSEDEVRFWEERITISRGILRRMQARWDESIRRYSNRHLPQIVDGDGPNVSVNILLSNVRAKLPFLFYQDPELLVRPQRPDSPPDLGALAKGLSLYYLRKQKARHKINRCILDGLLQSRGILKLGYSTRTVRSAPTPKKGGDPKKPFFGKRKRGRPRKESSAVDQLPPLRVTQEGPTLTHVSPRRFLTHPDAKFPIDDHARWVCHMSVQPIELVRIDERFDEKWRKEVKATEQLKEPRPDSIDAAYEFGGDERQRDPQSQFVVLYEIWEKTRREVMVFADGNFTHGPARVKAWPFGGMAGYPFSMYVPLEIPETFEAMTELDPIINQVEEMDHFRTMQARHLMRFKRFYEVTTDTIDTAELDKLRIREDGDFAITNAEDGRRSIYPVEDANMPLDSFRFIGDIKNDLDMVSGVSELRRQGQGSSKTATEASIVDQSQQARGVFDRQEVDDFVLDAIEKKFMIMQQWLPQNLAVEIMGPLGRDWVENVSPEMIEGEFDFSIVAGSTQPPNIALMRAEVTQLVQLLQAAPFVDHVDFHEVLRMILETYPELIRGGRLEAILKDPQATTGAVPPQQMGLPQQAGPPGMGGVPGLEGVSPEVQQLLAVSGGNGGF